MANGGEYFTTKGPGSQEVYDAYYASTGSTQTWTDQYIKSLEGIAERGGLAGVPLNYDARPAKETWKDVNQVGDRVNIGLVILAIAGYFILT